MKKSVFDIENQNSSIDSRIVASLERVSQAFRVLLWNESKSFALSPIQIQILVYLLNNESAQRKVSFLAQAFNLTKATISDTIKTLNQKHLIDKQIEVNDSRSYTIHLTEKGRKIANQTAFFANQLEVPISKMLERDKENLLLSLIEIIQHLNKTGVITVQRMCYTCQYYQADHTKGKHFCGLLNQKLENSEIRIDCPEHVPV